MITHTSFMPAACAGHLARVPLPSGLLLQGADRAGYHCQPHLCARLRRLGTALLKEASVTFQFMVYMLCSISS